MSFLSQFTPYSFPHLGLVRLPEVTISAKDREKLGLKPDASNARILRQLIWNGYKEKSASGRFKGFSEDEVKERLKMEFEVFEKTGTVDYFLLLWDISRWCDEQGILRGRGRGSSGGSLAMMFLGITDINSLEHGLHFTRFLSEARLKPKVIDGITYVDGKMAPDVDSDFEFLRRPEVLRYIEEKYQGRTCKISTRLQLTGRTALKNMLKTYLEFDETGARHVSDFVEEQYGNVDDLKTALDKSPDFIKWITEKGDHQRAFEMARGIEGLNIGKGQHPSGVFISYSPLDGNIPVELAKTKEVVTSYDMTVSATLGSKVDILGIRTLDVIRLAAKQVGLHPNDIDINHESIYAYYGKTDLYGGLFQIEDGLTKDVVRRIKPRNIDELAACVAISRPGALKYIDQFKDYVETGKLKSIHPKLDELLKATGNIILYQENITEVCQKLFGMTAVDADQVRYYVGKKLKEEMKKIEPILYEKGRANGVPEDIIKYFWDTCNASADYLFVKAHAYEYAYLTAQTTYLKANHPREFVYALLHMARHEPESQQVLKKVINEAREMGVAILPPDIIKSEADFAIQPDGIRFGLSSIKGVSDATMEKLASFRREFNNKFEVFEAAQSAKIPINILCGLIYSGTLDAHGERRARLAFEAQVYNLLTDREKLLVNRLGAEHKYDLLLLLKDLKDRLDEKGKPYIKPSRWQTFYREYEPYKRMYLENSRSEALCEYITERHFLGFSYSHTLHEIFSKRIEGLVPIVEALQAKENEHVSFVAFIDDVKKSVSLKSKKPYIKFFLSDETGSIKSSVHGEDRMAQLEQFHDGRMPEKGDVVVVAGSKGSGDLVFVRPGFKWKRGPEECLVRQPIPIVLRKSQLSFEPTS